MLKISGHMLWRVSPSSTHAHWSSMSIKESVVSGKFGFFGSFIGVPNLAFGNLYSLTEDKASYKTIL